MLIVVLYGDIIMFNIDFKVLGSVLYDCIDWNKLLEGIERFFVVSGEMLI